MPEKEKLRIDKYLWSIRLFKTRSLASEACDKGRVKLKGMSVKASKAVNMGDEYEVKTEAKKWQIKVTGLLHNRVQFAEAIKYYIDLTPEEELETVKVQAAAFHTGKRLSKIGRPTKKERRNLEDFTDPETAEE
jgi:ribosome-associated heat shock protein Hsp15